MMATSEKLLQIVEKWFCCIAFILILLNLIRGVAIELVVATLFCLLICTFIYLEAHRRRSLYLHIVNLYVLVVGPFQISVSQINSGYLTSSQQIVEALKESKAILVYIAIMVIFQFICIINEWMLSKIPDFKIKRIHIKGVMHLPTFLVFLIASMLSIIETYLRINHYLYVPGYVPRMRHSGVVFYALRSLSYLFPFLILYRYFVKRKINITSYSTLYLMILICACPSMVAGERGPLISLTLICFLFLLFGVYDVKKINLKKGKTIILFVICIIVVLLLYGGVNLLRFGKFSIISNIMSRFTGVADGVRALDYLEGKPPMSLSNFFVKFLTGTGWSSNNYYTYQIRGYSPDLHHSNALPFFVSAWFYNGYAGLIILTFFLSSFLLSVTKTIEKETHKARNDTKGDLIGIYGILYASLLLMINICMSVMIDGNLTSWKTVIVVPALFMGCLIFCKE